MLIENLETCSCVKKLIIHVMARELITTHFMGPILRNASFVLSNAISNGCKSHETAMCIDQMKSLADTQIIIQGLSDHVFYTVTSQHHAGTQDISFQ